MFASSNLLRLRFDVNSAQLSNSRDASSVSAMNRLISQLLASNFNRHNYKRLLN